ncbi:hypothetical protein L202_02014 [Cryptococcus amylolentus CBS 6039]|uniref:Galactose oxidase n=2 Tax=Cryptococcus amylolentus TaxID=104669 RepID=A0A1E3HZ24_9TREE|nr:hypothetical protein L202_02014 [Cryptococcus amylolentus CBS 6039]ODN81603.1 hypothetical protein L202_02014 [Cryptococcus amylolentus CBS 6039]ODO10175.1 hypothetical protein I350_02404 [Cryptococcus amylolentus CBS 6273]
MTHKTLLICALLYTATAQAYEQRSDITSRWGQAAAYISSPPTLILQGGKTDSSFSYSSAPNTASTLLLPLSSSFNASSPPWTELDSSSGPTASWHTLSPVSESGDTWQLLSFGGDGSGNQASTTANDSTWLMTLDTSSSSDSYAHQTTDWASQPMNRVYHSAASSSDGKVYITGGLKGDGSGVTFSDVYEFDPSTASFSALPSLPEQVYHHTSVLLSNGTLLVFGGAYTSQATSNADVRSFNSIYRLDVSSDSPAWDEITLSSDSLPTGRRGATAALSGDGKKVVLIGGASAGLGDVYGDVWVLDVDTLVWEQTSSVDGAGSRYDHSAVAVGYSTSGPADSTLYIFSTSTFSWVTEFSALSSSSSGSDSSSSSQQSESGGSTTTNNIPSSIGQPNSPGSASTGAPASTGTSGSAGSGHGSVSTPGSESSGSPTLNNPVPTSTESTTPSDAGANSHPLTTSILVGVIVGSVGLFALVLGLCLWVIRRRSQRRRIGKEPVWPASGPRGHIPSGATSGYGGEKRGPGLMDEMREKSMPNASASGAVSAHGGWGAALGAVNAQVSSISSRIRAARWAEPYTELHGDSPGHEDPVAVAPGPPRKLTRREAQGIRLIGPRPQRGKSLYYAPNSPNKPARASVIWDERIDMLSDEDTRQYNDVCPASYSDSDSEGDLGLWRRSGESERGSGTDLSGPILVPFKGGPVPTPKESEAGSVNSAQRYQLPNFGPTEPLDLFSWLTTKNSRHTGTNVSAGSGRSGVTDSSRQQSDLEEGIVVDGVQRGVRDEASIVSLSPLDPVEPTPLRRNESFLKRMADAGVSVFRKNSQASDRSRAGSQIGIRDPAPQPTLWPIESRDQSSAPSAPTNSSPTTSSPESAHPPTSLPTKAARLAHHTGPSISSINSARSMRDMVLVQREGTDEGSESVGVVEEAPEAYEDDRLMGYEEGDDTMRVVESEDEGESESDITSSVEDQWEEARTSGYQTAVEDEGDLMADFDFGPNSLDLSLNDVPIAPVKSDHRLSSVSIPSSLPTVSESGEPASPERSPSPETAVPEAPIPAPPAVIAAPTAPKPRTVPKIEPKKFEHPPAPTAPLRHVPLPKKPSFNHTPKAKPPASGDNKGRRPVRDVVNSINKRGAKTPTSLITPRVMYSHAPERVTSIRSSDTGSSEEIQRTATPPRPVSVGESSQKSARRISFAEPAHKTATPPRPLSYSYSDPFADGSPSASSPARPSSTTPSRMSSPSRPTSLLGSPPSKRNSSGMGILGLKEKTTIWEVIKKEEKLKIANPDGRRRTVSGRELS